MIKKVEVQMEEKRLKFYDDIFPNKKKKKRRIFAENNELVTKTIKLLKQNKKSLHNLDDSFLRTMVHGIIRFTDWLLSNYYEIQWNVDGDLNFSFFDEEIVDDIEFNKTIRLCLKKVIREIEKLKKHPKYGQKYRDVLYYQFISMRSKTIAEVQRELGIRNSQFYRLTDEAMSHLVLNLWDYYFFNKNERVKSMLKLKEIITY